MDTDIKEKTLDKLTKSQSVLISVDQNTGLDGLASGLALYLSFQKLQKPTTLVAKTPSVGDASQLYGVNKINKEAGNKNLVIAIDNAVKNVDKVTYFLDGNKLRIVIHALPDSDGISKEEITYEQQEQKPDFIILIGDIHPENVNTEITPEQIKDSDTWIINVTKNKLKKNIAHLSLIDQQAGSLSELITLLFQELALPVDEDISYNLYTGIASATHNFSASLTKSQTFKSAEWLIKFGAGKASLSENFEPTPVAVHTGIDKTLLTENTFQGEIIETPIEQVERKESTQDDWLKPPKIYKGGKSFDSEH